MKKLVTFIGAATLAIGFGCAGFMGNQTLPVGSLPGLDPQTLSMILPLVQEGAAFALCPKEARVVSILNNQVHLTCAGTDAGSFSCPVGKVPVGFQINVGTKKAEVVCADAPAPAPVPASPSATPTP